MQLDFTELTGQGNKQQACQHVCQLGDAVDMAKVPSYSPQGLIYL